LKFPLKNKIKNVFSAQFNNIYEDVKAFFNADLNTLAKNINHLNQLSDQADMLYTELKTFCNEELMLRSVIVTITTLIKFINKTVKPLNEVLLPKLKE
jgi:hypothetical protein